MITPSSAIAVIGFGEAGSILGEDLARRGCSVRAYDILLDDAATAAPMRHRIELAGADVALTLEAALRGVKLVISAVTATCASQVARDSARHLTAGQVYLDINSMASASKHEAARLIEARGAHYLDATWMSPAPLQSLAEPMLLGGDKAAQVAPALNALGFAARAVAAEAQIAPAAAHGFSRRKHTDAPSQRVPRGELP
jgi:3-hydroxyisobutyrate dehydrogenase-like beta-hydroxyacid dehydrogenase